MHPRRSCAAECIGGPRSRTISRVIALTLAAWLHDLDPFVVRFSEAFGIRWYGLSYVAGFALGWLVLTHLARRGLIRVAPHLVADLILAVVVGTVLGGRLGYVLIYRPELLWTVEPGFPWWGVLAINKGGMASHGGMAGIILGCLWFGRRHGLGLAHVMDCIALVAPLGILLGRLANFVNGELLGRIAAMPGAPAPWWSVKFPQELTEPTLRPPLDPAQQQALEALLLRFAQPGDDEVAAAGRMIEALHHKEPGLAEALAPLISARHPSQLYQAFAEGLFLFTALWVIWARPRRPGVITAWFFIIYGVGRVLTEFIRLPDAHLHVQRIYGLSRGQWLSVLMIGVGIAIYAWARRAPASSALGGWRARPEAAPGVP